MNLEQRVQVLEQEVQLLKAQIQATLLDMQEQLLNAKYPILRAEETTNAAPPAAQMPAAPAANASPVKRVLLTEPNPEEEQADVRPMRAAPSHMPDDDSGIPAVVQVRSNGHRPAPVSEPPPAPRRGGWEDEDDYPQSRASRVVEPPKPRRGDWEDEDYAQPRASRVMEPPKPRRGDWEDEDYAQPRAPRVSEPPKPARPEPVAQNHVAHSQNADDQDARDWIELENWVSQKVEKLGITRTRELINLYTRQERFSRQERELLLQFVSIYDGASKTLTAQKPKAAPSPNPTPRTLTERPSIVPQTRAVVEEIRNERQKRNAAKNKTESYHLSEQQELVMRLIAGILNAGDDEESSGSGF